MADTARFASIVAALLALTGCTQGDRPQVCGSPVKAGSFTVTACDGGRPNVPRESTQTESKSQ